MLELYYNYFRKYCYGNKFEEVIIDTDSWYLALTEYNLNDCILPEKKVQWTVTHRNDCRNDFIADAVKKIFLVHAALFIKIMTSENSDYSKKNFAVLKCCACAARRIAAMIVRATNLKLVARTQQKNARRYRGWTNVQMQTSS